MTTDPATTRTVQDVLGEALASPTLEGALEHGTDGVPLLGRLSSVGRRIVARNAAAALGDALDIDLLTVAERAWTTSDRLVAAGYRTASGGAPEHVEVGKHVIHSTHEPTVDVLVGDRVAVTVRFAVVLELEVAHLRADVRDGLLVAVDPGPCRLTASLTCEGVAVPPAGRASVRLVERLDLGTGLRLVPASFRPEPTSPVVDDAPTMVLRLPEQPWTGASPLP